MGIPPPWIVTTPMRRLTLGLKRAAMDWTITVMAPSRGKPMPIWMPFVCVIVPPTVMMPTPPSFPVRPISAMESIKTAMGQSMRMDLPSGLGTPMVTAGGAAA